MPDRNRIRVESNQRVDKPDFEALQLGAHLAVRYAVRGLFFGTDATDQTVVTSSWTLATAGTELTVTPGRAVAGETMADATVQQGHVIGEDGDTSQTLDFNGEPADTYFVYARPDFSPGVSGSRIFWNAATETEDASPIDTREVSGWRVVAATSSPGTGYVQVGTAVWNGAAFTSVSAAGLHFFEGMLQSTGVEFGDQWGGGANDRNANRATYGVQSVFRAFALVRRQLKDIIGAASGGWHSAVPTSLTAAKTHIDTVSDPHGAAPTWSGKPVFNGGIDVNGHGDFRGAGYVEVDEKTDLRFANAQDGSFNIAGFACESYITNGVASATLGLVDGGNARLNNDSTASMSMVIPIHIPEGATITSAITFGYWENTSGADATLTARLWRLTNVLGLVAVVDEGSDSENDTTAGLSGSGFGSAVVTPSAHERSVTDSYVLQLTLNNNGEASKLSLSHINVQYAFDNVVG